MPVESRAIQAYGSAARAGSLAVERGCEEPLKKGLGVLSSAQMGAALAWAKGPTIVQVHGIGRFAFTYVNPADDPRNQH